MTAKQEISNWMQQHRALQTPAEREQFHQKILGELAAKSSDWHGEGLSALKETARESREKAEAFIAHHKEIIPYHSSYLLAQQDNITDKIQRLRREHPGLPLTKVVTTILSELPENMASRLVRELTLFIIESWEEVSAEALKAA